MPNHVYMYHNEISRFECRPHRHPNADYVVGAISIYSDEESEESVYNSLLDEVFLHFEGAQKSVVCIEEIGGVTLISETHKLSMTHDLWVLAKLNFDVRAHKVVSTFPVNTTTVISIREA